MQGDAADSVEKIQAKGKAAEVQDDEGSKLALAAVSDLDYFRAKQGTLSDDDDDEGDNAEEEEEDNIESSDEEQGNDVPGDEPNEDAAQAEENDGDEGVKSGGEEGAEGDGIESVAGVHESRLAGLGEARRVGEGGEVADEASVAETGRLFVRNLPYTCTEDELADMFKRFGPLAEVCKSREYLPYIFSNHIVHALGCCTMDQ